MHHSYEEKCIPEGHKGNSNKWKSVLLEKKIHGHDGTSSGKCINYEGHVIPINMPTAYYFFEGKTKGTQSKVKIEREFLEKC